MASQKNHDFEEDILVEDSFEKEVRFELEQLAWTSESSFEGNVTAMHDVCNSNWTLESTLSGADFGLEDGIFLSDDETFNAFGQSSTPTDQSASSLVNDMNTVMRRLAELDILECDYDNVLLCMQSHCDALNRVDIST